MNKETIKGSSGFPVKNVNVNVPVNVPDVAVPLAVSPVKYLEPGELFGKIAAKLGSARRLALFMDYDGTLRAIAGRPKDAVPGRRLMAMLRRLERLSGVRAVIVTGRGLDSIRELVPLSRAWFVGTHGVEIARGGGRPRNLVGTWKARAAVQAMVRAIRPHLDSTFTLENKGMATALHFRRADPMKARQACLLFRALARPHIRGRVLKLIGGKGVLEARPAGAHKGLAVRAVIGGGRGGRTWCLALGDDTTDEDLFRAVRGPGVSVAVGSNARGARYRLRGPREAVAFLNRVADAWLDLSRPDKLGRYPNGKGSDKR